MHRSPRQSRQSWWCLAALAIDLLTSKSSVSAQTDTVNQYPPCYVCADDGISSITLRNAIYSIPVEYRPLFNGKTTIPCLEVEYFAEMAGDVSPDVCVSIVQELIDLQRVCGCPNAPSTIDPAPSRVPSVGGSPTVTPAYIEPPVVVASTSPQYPTFSSYNNDDDWYSHDNNIFIGDDYGYDSDDDNDIHVGVAVVFGLIFSVISIALVFVVKARIRQARTRNQLTAPSSHSGNTGATAPEGDTLGDRDTSLIKKLDEDQRRDFVENMLPHLSVGPQLPVHQETCAICQDSFEDGASVCRSNDSNCKHIFCRHCIVKWLLQSDSCPCCQRNFLSLDSVLDLETARPNVSSASTTLSQERTDTMQLENE